MEVQSGEELSRSYVGWLVCVIHTIPKKSTKNLFLFIKNRSEHTFIVDGWIYIHVQRQIKEQENSLVAKNWNEE